MSMAVQALLHLELQSISKGLSFLLAQNNKSRDAYRASLFAIMGIEWMRDTMLIIEDDVNRIDIYFCVKKVTRATPIATL